MAASTPTPDKRIKLAICGGGIAGICLAIGLRKHHHIDAQLFEAGDTFKERGAGVGLSQNAQRAMEMIDPELRMALDRAGAVRMIPSLRILLVRVFNFGLSITPFY